MGPAMNNKPEDNPPISKADLEALSKQFSKQLSEGLVTLRHQVREDIDEAVSSSAQEVLTAVGDRLDQVDANLARIESKLDPTITQVADHELRIQALEGAA